MQLKMALKVMSGAICLALCVLAMTPSATAQSRVSTSKQTSPTPTQDRSAREAANDVQRPPSYSRADILKHVTKPARTYEARAISLTAHQSEQDGFAIVSTGNAERLPNGFLIPPGQRSALDLTLNARPNGLYFFTIWMMTVSSNGRFLTSPATLKNGLQVSYMNTIKSLQLHKPAETESMLGVPTFTKLTYRYDHMGRGQGDVKLHIIPQQAVDSTYIAVVQMVEFLPADAVQGKTR